MRSNVIGRRGKLLAVAMVCGGGGGMVVII
jgi:hypothetical protein